MPERILSIEEVEANPYAALRATQAASVLIQESGRIAYALISYDEHVRMLARISSEVVRLGPAPTD
jgi:hypothetical protein